MDDQDEISRRIDAWIRRTAYAPHATSTVAESARARMRRWAQGILAADDHWMILDTETTGFGNADDIIEVAAVTPRGETLIDCLIRPGRRIPYEITQLTGISNEMVAGSPRFSFAWEHFLNAHLGTRGIIAYNAPFDVRMLTQNIQRHCRLTWSPVRSDCLMRAYASYRGERTSSGGYRSHKLGVACAHMGLRHDHAHRALGDCLVSAQLLRAMAE
ncbi:MAG TPA: 3'-5' exonuclease [Ktedonobacterales bacterium]|nr:3'-5' exonuclease [Ktedonobacterales bacterium]